MSDPEEQGPKTWLGIFSFGEAETRRRQELRAKRKAQHSRPTLREAGNRTDAGLACPKCGSTQFTAKRSLGGKLMAGLLAPKSRVKCVVCGTEYRRGV